MASTEEITWWSGRTLDPAHLPAEWAAAGMVCSGGWHLNPDAVPLNSVHHPLHLCPLSLGGVCWLWGPLGALTIGWGSRWASTGHRAVLSTGMAFPQEGR